jgi:subtilisin family serine protease
MRHNMYSASAVFTSPKSQNDGTKTNLLKFLRACLAWLLLAAVFASGLPVRTQAEALIEMGSPRSFKVIALDSENERPSKITLTGLTQSASASERNLIKVRLGRGTNEYAVLQIEYKSVPARQAKFTDSRRSMIGGASVLTTVAQFADVFVGTKDAYALSQILNDPEVVRAELATIVSVPPPPPSDPARYSIKGIPETIVRDGFTDANGKRWAGRNVIIAVIDTGVDFTHPDFIKYDEHGNPTSRLVHFWDTTLDFSAGRGDRAPFFYPNGTPIGTYFNQRQMTEELRALKKGAPPRIPSTDEDGHGTACASIAAGNGNADQSESGLKRDDVIGVAPEALLVGVRIGKSGSGLTNAYLLNAICEWLDGIAGAQPLVVSASFGGNHTGHDGQSVHERELNARFGYGERKGRVMVVAAGNESRKSIHARVAFGGVEDAKIVKWKAEVATKIGLFFNSPSARNLKIIPSGETRLQKGQLRWELNRITNQVQATLSVNVGEGQIRLFNSAGEKTEAHLYFNSSKDGRFVEGVDNYYLVTSPGSANDVITVGSYDWNDSFHLSGRFMNLSSACQLEGGDMMSLEIGGLSCYSSPGPTRDARYKPDVVAPGQWYTASYSASATGWTVDTTGRYVAMRGTSAAAPYAAGVIALLLEEEPSLSTNQIKQLFKQNLTKTDLKPYPARLPDAAWGSGKLDVAAVERLFEAVSKSRATR